jgi:hypothetical protein
LATPQPDLVETARDVPVTLWPLANDAPTGLLVVAFQQPSFGTVTFDAEAQSFTYTPAPGFVGEDSFDYTVQGPDGATATATVTVRVVQPNRPPVAVDDLATVAPGGTVEIDPLANDSDPDADPLTLVALGRPDSGSVTVLDGRRLRYAPRTGFVGEDSFTYTVSDGRGGTASATVRIGVAADNRAPTAPTLRTSTLAGQPVVVDLLAAASDPDGDPLVVTALGLPEHGTVAILEAGRVTYTPASGFEGTDRFTYTVGDGRGGTATGEVEIVVSLPNSAPRAVDDSATTETGNPVTIDVLANDSDAEGGPLTLSRLSLPEHGRVRVESDQRLTYVSDAGFVGTDSFTYTVRDPRGAEASATVTVDVTAPAAPTTFLNGYRYRRRIVVPRGSVLGTAPLVGFPLLVAEEGAWLKSTAHGGRVESAQGFDLRFELETGGKLPHDVERYDPVAGRLVAWVRLTELRPNEDLVLFLYYGKPGLGASEADPAATWRDYLAVWHLPDPTDRTGRGRDLVATAVSTTEGPIGAAGRFDGTASELVLADPSFLDGHASLTVQLWVDSDRLDSDRGLLVCGPITGRDFDSAFVLRHASRGLYSSQARVFTAEMALADGRLVYESSPGRADDAAHALALVFDRGEGATLVVDGVADTPSYTVGSTLLGPTRIGRGPLRIGTGPLQSSAGRWLGLIDEVRLRATALPAAWLAMEHANQRAPATFYGIGGEDAFGDPNEAPVAAPLAARTTVGSAILLDPLAFASSPGGGTPVLAAVGTPTRGTTTIEAGKIRYTPASGFVGTDRFTYTISKDGKSSTGTVSIRVEARASETSPAQDRPFADRFYGNPFHADGLAERRLQPGSPVAKRFLADRTGSLVAIGWPWRVDSGDGGDVVVKIETDHEGKPSGLAIGTTAINGDRGKPATQGASPEWSFEQPVPLEAGRAYHVVWYQVGTSGTVSILHHRAEVPIPTGRNLRGGPYEGDGGTIHQQSGGIWRPGSEHGGFLQLVWSDGLVTGNPVVAGAPGLKKSFGGPLMVRERFTVTDYTRKVDGVWLRVWWESGTPGDLLVRLETLEGTLLEQLVVPRTALPQTRNVAGDATSAPALWVHRRFTQAHTLERGRSYVLRLSTSAGSYVVHAVRRSDAPSREQWFDAWAELSTNGGGAWRGWDDSGDASGVPRTDCHLPIAFSIAGSVERVGVDSLIGTANWSFGDVRRLAEDAGLGDGLGEAHAVVNGGTAWAHLGFPTPSRPPVGRQTFRIRARCSVSGGAIRVELFENGVFRRDLGTQPVGTSFSTLNFTWDAGLLADPTGAGVELRLGLVDNLSSGYYVVDAVDWLADPAGSTSGSGGGGSVEPQGAPPGWGPRPQLGSWHGIGQPFNFAYNGQGQLVWQPLRDYNEWLGRPANIVKVWPLMSAATNWDAIAGGAGSSDTTWGGQLNELNPNRAFDPAYWPVANPIVLALTGVPASHSNAQNSNGTWGRPGIWQEIVRGDYDVYYTRLFRRIATRCGQTGRDPRTVVIRWCWEANGNWYPHSIGPDKANFVAAWRRCMDLMRSAVSAVLGAGKSFLIEFGPAGHLRFGNGGSERLWNVYPGDDWVDVCGLGIHDQLGIRTQADWDKYLRHPTTIAGTPFEGILDWFDFGASRNKWLGTSEIECNYVDRTYFPKTQNMEVFWRTGFEVVRQRYASRFVYFIYLWNGDSALKRADGWGEPYRLLYRP